MEVQIWGCRFVSLKEKKYTYLLFSANFECLHLHKYDLKDTRLNFFLLKDKIKTIHEGYNSERNQ